MCPKMAMNGKVNISNLLKQYDKLFNKVKKDQQEVKKESEKEAKTIGKPEKKVMSDEELSARETCESEDHFDILPSSHNTNSLVKFNNKNNPEISIFDAYAFNEVMRRYENAIVQLTRQETKVMETENVKEKYDVKISELKASYNNKILELDSLREKEKNMQEIVDQVNDILDEKDNKILEYEKELDVKLSEVRRMKSDLMEKEKSINAMERQLYTVLFKVTEGTSVV